jgi:transposase-like protein
MTNPRGNLALRELNERQRAVALSLAYGDSVEACAARHKVKVHTIRSLCRQPSFRHELALLRDTAKAIAQPEAVHVLVQTMRTVGKDEASDRAVRVKAAQALLYEGKDNPNPNGVNVSVGVQVNNDIRPGYIIRLKAEEPQTIEHQP